MTKRMFSATRNNSLPLGSVFGEQGRSAFCSTVGCGFGNFKRSEQAAEPVIGADGRVTGLLFSGRPVAARRSIPRSAAFGIWG